MSNQHGIRKYLDVPVVTPVSAILLVIVLAGAVAIGYRLWKGLGAATNLSDNFPWGLWISVDVITGVALAAGGFTLAAIVYIFQLEKYRPVVRPAILTALLGYAMVAIGITLDIGRPYRIVWVIFNWNPRSVMFEVSWCVILYLTVLVMEFVPAVYERLGFQRMVNIWRYLLIPLVIAGITLSFLHQSSLGALFMIAPNRLNELWYSPFMHYLFFVSAAGVGLAMVIFESTISSRVFKVGLEKDVLAGLGKAVAYVLAFYLLIRVVDLLARGALSSTFDDSLAGTMFIIEIALGVVLPMVLLFMPRVRDSSGGLFGAASLVILGVVLNRLNVSLIGMAKAMGGSYFPSWIEILTTLAIIAGGVLAFKLAVTYLPVFHAPEKTEAAAA